MSNDRGYFSQVDIGRSVLAGHNRVKKKIISPLSNIPLVVHRNTTAEIFPELLWIAALFERFGYHRSIRVAVPFRKALNAISEDRPWYLLSEIATLTAGDWLSLKEEDGPFKDEMIAALSALLVYPQLALTFMRDHPVDNEIAVEFLERCVGRHCNRFETPGVAVIGTFVSLEALAGKIRVPKETLEGISAIVDKPESDEAEIGASGARALLMAFWGTDQAHSRSWPSEFWRTNLKLSACRDRKGR
jgi:hypothetical protein